METRSRYLVERCGTTDEITVNGKSVVQISHKEGAISDRVSGQDLREIASILVQLCVVGENEGGAAFGIGRY